MGRVFTYGSSGGSLNSVTAEAADVLNPKVIVDKNGNAITGTMTNRGAYKATTEYGQPLPIPEGYHNGQGYITGGTIKASSVTATAADVLSGKKLLDKNGNVITGTMTNRGAYNATIPYGESISIPEGYHNGSGVVRGGTMSFEGNANPWDVFSGVKYYSNDSTLRVGTMSDYSGQTLGYEGPLHEGNAGYFWIKALRTGYFNRDSFILFPMQECLDGMVTASDDKSSGNNIRKGPSTDYSTATFYYTGKVDGYQNRWHEVIVYGWQYR